ncbi:SGNH hydrolase domain-containing protein [soil metagenome]
MFRPEINALRAVAVVSVVTYHLWPERLPGGYTGVDIFFVISGFLITGHLHREVRQSGRVHLGRFWARRIRRLVPAASVVLLASLVLMLAVVPHSLWQRTATEIGASALYAQNWVLAANSVDYLGADGTPTLVQHFWSLSVEEQFYLVWPVLIVLVLRFRRGITVALGAVFVLSLGYSIVNAGAASYFSTATRAWEFAVGGLLALTLPRLPLAGRRAASWLGIGLIVATLVTFGPATPFPSGWALLPVIGAALVIAGEGTALGGVVSLRPIQFVGRISYSLYLWHWPLIVALPYLTTHPLTWPDAVVVLAASVVLAALTTRFVEDPVRRSVRLSRTRAASLLAACTVGLLVIASGAVVTSVRVTTVQAAAALRTSETAPCFGERALATGCSRPFEVPAGFDAAFWAADKGALGSCNSVTEQVVQCAFGDITDPSRTVALVGNSHAGHLVPGLEDYGKEHGWKFVLMRKTGCAGALTDVVLPQVKLTCVHWSRNVDAVLRDPANGIDAVAFASNDEADHYVATSALSSADASVVVAAIGRNLAQLERDGLSVVALGDVPGALPAVAPECVDEHLGEYDPCATRRVAPVDDLVASAARATPGVGFVDLVPWFCDATRCHVVIGGALVYLDGHHLTATFSRSLGPYLGAALALQIRE